MKRILLGLSVLCAGYAQAQNGLENIVVEKYYIANAADNTGDYPVAANSVTYRIYADMLPNYTFQAAYGDPNHTMKIETTTKFFNNEDRGNSSPTYTKAQAANNTVMLDSWLSVGGAAAGQLGVMKTEDDGVATVVNANSILANTNALAGIPLTTQDGMIAGTVQAVGFSPTLDVSMFADVNSVSGLFTTNGDTWYAAPGVVGPTAENRVLIAQITTDGDLSFELNIQIGTPNGGTEKYVAKDAAVDEIVLSSLTQSFVAFVPNSDPTITLTSPSSSAKITEDDAVTITATANDSDGTVTSVEFMVDGVVITTITTAPYTVDYIAKKGNHIITAKVTDNSGATTTSTELAITVDQKQTSLESIENKPAELTVYPAIATQTINASVSNYSKTVTYEVFDIIGNKILAIANADSTQKIDVSQLSQGQYIVVVSFEGNRIAKKIIKK